MWVPSGETSTPPASKGSLSQSPVIGSIRIHDPKCGDEATDVPGEEDVLAIGSELRLIVIPGSIGPLAPVSPVGVHGDYAMKTESRSEQFREHNSSSVVVGNYKCQSF